MRLWPFSKQIEAPKLLEESPRDWRMLELERWKNTTEMRISRLEAIVDVIQARREVVSQG